MVAGKELLNIEDLQESCNQLFKYYYVGSCRLYNVCNPQEEALKSKTVKDYRSLRLQ